MTLLTRPRRDRQCSAVDRAGLLGRQYGGLLLIVAVLDATAYFVIPQSTGRSAAQTPIFLSSAVCLLIGAGTFALGDAMRRKPAMWALHGLLTVGATVAGGGVLAIIASFFAVDWLRSFACVLPLPIACGLHLCWHTIEAKQQLGSPVPRGFDALREIDAAILREPHRSDSSR